MESRKGFAVAVIVNSPHGIPLVRDPRKPAPQYWKFPGGKSHAGETPKQTAVRETKEETGIKILESQLILLDEEARRDHFFFAFEAPVMDLISLKERGDEGEEIKLFSAEYIKRMKDLFPPHRKLLKEKIRL